MLKKRARGSAPSPATSPESAPRPYRVLKRTVDIILVAATVAVVVYLAGFLVKVSRGYSLTQDTPALSVRLQLVNASGDRGAAGRYLQKLQKMSDFDLEIAVVDTVWLERRQVPRTLVVARSSDQASARVLAQRLGLDDGEVEFRELEHNARNVTATLVLGRDVALAKPPNPRAKEQH